MNIRKGKAADGKGKIKKSAGGVSKKAASAQMTGRNKRVSFHHEVASKVIEGDVNVSQTFETPPLKSILKRKRPGVVEEPDKKKTKKTTRVKVEQVGEPDFPVVDFEIPVDDDDEESEGDENSPEPKVSKPVHKKVIKKKVGQRKLLVRKSLKEKLLAMGPKERRAFIKKLKAEKKPNFELTEKCKKLWEVCRSKRTKSDEREKAINALFNEVKGNAVKMAYAHDSARVLQYLISLKRPEIRDAVFDELKTELIKMAKSKYARFFVMRLLKYGTPDQRTTVINSFDGHCMALYRTVWSATVLERAYNDFCSKVQRHNIECEFYGKEYVITKKSGGTTTIQDIEKLDDAKKKLVADNLFETIEIAIDKELLKYSLTHKLLLDFFTICNEQQRKSAIELLNELVPQFCHTREGSRAALYCVWYGSAKDRKSIVKSFKDVVVSTAKDEFAHRVLLAIFDAVDDTRLVNKVISKDIGNYIGDIIYDKYGQWVLHYITYPRDPRFFLKGTLQMLKLGDDNGITKKPAADRHREIFDDVKEPLLTFMAANMRELLYNKLSAVLVLNILQPPVAGEPFPRTLDTELKAKCFEAIAEVAGEEFIPYQLEREPHVIESGCACYVFSMLIRQDAQQVDVKLSDYLADLPDQQLASFMAINKGCFVLRNMIISGSTKAEAAVKRAVNVKTLKKHAFVGAKLLLEALEGKKEAETA